MQTIRTDDSFLSLEERNRAIVAGQPDFFIAVHHNSIDLSVDANLQTGTECYYFYPAGKALAQALVRNVTQATSRPDRGAQWGYYYVTRSTVCPAVLLEAGFMVNPSEYENVTSEPQLWAAGGRHCTQRAGMRAAGLNRAQKQTPPPRQLRLRGGGVPACRKKLRFLRQAACEQGLRPRSPRTAAFGCRFALHASALALRGIAGLLQMKKGRLRAKSRAFSAVVRKGGFAPLRHAPAGAVTTPFSGCPQPGRPNKFLHF